MGSQLRFDPSFFGLALRASAEADALLFSAHEGLSGITRPTRAGLRLTSPAKASGGRPSMHKERIPLHKENGFLCRKRGARGKRAAEAGARRKRVRILTRRARGKHSPAYHSMSRGGCQGEYAPGWHLGAGEDRVGQAVRAQRRQRRGTRGEMSANEQKRAEVSKGKCETREGRNGLKKLIRTNPHRAQKRV